MSTPDAEISQALLPRHRDLLAKSMPLPDRLHLSHTSRTTAAQRADARLDALVAGGIAIVPTFVLCSILKNLGGDRSALAVIAVCIIAGVALYRFFKVRLDRALAWEQRTWLDFNERTWRSSKTYVHPSVPHEALTIPFRSLGLVCYDASVEENIRFGLDLCQFSDMATYCHYRSECTHAIFDHTEESVVSDYAVKLAETWSIDCWKFFAPYEGGLRRIFTAPVSLPPSPPA